MAWAGVYWSAFVTHLMAEKRHVPPAVWTSIRDAGLARLQERQAAGRGDAPLEFGDLAERLEEALWGSAARHIGK